MSTISESYSLVMIFSKFIGPTTHRLVITEPAYHLTPFVRNHFSDNFGLFKRIFLLKLKKYYITEKAKIVCCFILQESFLLASSQYWMSSVYYQAINFNCVDSAWQLPKINEKVFFRIICQKYSSEKLENAENQTQGSRVDKRIHNLPCQQASLNSGNFHAKVALPPVLATFNLLHSLFL